MPARRVTIKKQNDPRISELIWSYSTVNPGLRKINRLSATLCQKTAF